MANKTSPSCKLQAWNALEEKARASSVGMWTADEVLLNASRPVLQTALTHDARSLLEQAKDQTIPGLVEHVRDGSTLRVLLLPTHQFVTVMLSGIRAPVCRLNGPESDSVTEPFAEEAKYFVETRLLQREVGVRLEGVTTSGQAFFGSILHPAGNIAELLVANGLARVVDWSITMVSQGPEKLRAAEKLAKSRRLKMWQDHQDTSKALNVSEKEFDGAVIRIVSADTVLVESSVTCRSHKITLSSIRQPKMKDPRESHYHQEAREFLRSRLIGNKVHVAVDYVRPPTEGFDEERVCGSITLGIMNVGEALINKGLAGLIRHRQNDDDRARNYDQLLLAEDKASKAKIGVFSDKEPPIVRLVDASESAAKARSFMPSLKRGGRLSAIVEYVAGPSRYRLFIPKENCKLSFTVASVKCPRVGRNESEKSERFGSEALNFVSKLILQRDVEIEVDSVDRAGCFIGSIWLGKDNVGVLLLQNGYGSIMTYSADQSSYTSQLYAAENLAKTKKLNIWTLVQEVQPTEVSVSAVAKEPVEVSVTEVLDACRMYVQIDNSAMASLDKMMKELSLVATSPSITPKVGELVCAQFSLDNTWYRARIRRILGGKKYEVFYVDYGNSETITQDRVRKLPADLFSIPALATELRLSFIRVPSLDQDYGVEAAEFLKSLVSQTSMQANIDYRAGPVLYATIFLKDTNGSKVTIQEELLKNGWAQVLKRSIEGVDWDRLTILETDARRDHLGMFEYGDYALEQDE